MFHRNAHPAGYDAASVRGFIYHLANRTGDHPFAASTLRQALTALRFLHDAVLGMAMPPATWKAVRAKAPGRQPAAAPPASDLVALIRRLHGQHRTLALLQLGSGLRLREALALRLMDVDCSAAQLRCGDRSLPLSRLVAIRLRRQLRRRRSEGARDADAIFSSRCRAADGRRRPPTERSVQRAYKAVGPGITPRRLRHAFACALLESGHDARRVQALMGYRQLGTVLDHLQATGRGAGGQPSPLDGLPLRA